MFFFRNNMVVVHKKSFLKDKKKYLSLIKNGKSFVYPTDTIYGLGCDATNAKAVQHIRLLKQREKKPFSVIVPSKEWIIKNCVISAAAKKWLHKLPGKYTFILKLNNKKAVSRQVHLGDYTVGVRIPKHWFAGIVAEYGKPIVTTSVNITAKPFMNSLSDLPLSIRKRVAFILYEGGKKTHPSILIDFVANKNGNIARRR